MYWLDSIPNDKLKHMLAGMLVYGLIGIWSIGLAIVLVLLVGIGKEVYDSMYKDKHTPDVMDAVYTIAVPVVLYVLEKIV